MRQWRMIAAFTVLLATAAHAQDLRVRYLRMYSVNYDPWIDATSERLHTYGGWNDPVWLNSEYLSDFDVSSHGLVQIRQPVELNMDDYPIMTDGYRYTDATFTAAVDYWYGGGGQGLFHTQSGADYKAISRNFDFARRVDFGEIDEVNNNCAPFFGYWETNMSGYGGYWCNSGPQPRIACSRIYVITGFNYERGVAEMIHSNAHRTESVMSETYGSWNTNGDSHLWDRFGWNVGQTMVSEIYGIGSCHYPPNGASDYDYANEQLVPSYAPAWLNDFPAFNGKGGAFEITGRETWGGPDYQRNFLIWWYQHLPHLAGTNSHDGYVRLNNWWEYIFNFNAHAESGGDFDGGSPPAATPYGGTVYQLTNDTRDAWRPQVNAAGRVVWAGADATYHVMTIFSCNEDGSDLRQHTNFGRISEMPQINAAGQIVFQQFDGRDFEIYTCNANGTGLVRRITNNAVQDWHPAINDSGRIVWEQFDGVDYEVYSCNFDGTGLTRLTNNDNGGVGLPRDDMWPRINNSGRVVWMGYDGSNWDIFSAQSDGTGFVNVSNNTYENEYPQISDNGQVVWHAWHSNSNAEVYVANATGGGVTRITNNGVMDWWPQINASGVIVWMQRSNDWEIMRRQTNGTVAAVTNNTAHDQYPVIDNDGRIAWQGFDGHDMEIYLYDGGAIYQVTNNSYDDRAPALVTGGSVVWHGESAIGDPNDPNYAGPTTEIFLASPDDFLPPTLTGATAVGNRQRVVAAFSEAVDPATAEVATNYTIDHGATVSAAVVGSDPTTVKLTTSPLADGVVYTLSVSNVTDLAGNVIAPGSSVTFSYAPAQRVTDGLVVLYDFEEESGATVHDVSGVGSPLDLTIATPANTTWTQGGLRFDTATAARSAAAATKVISACTASNEITIEGWIQPTTAAPASAARIVTLSPHANSCDFALGQGLDAGVATSAYVGRLRTTTTTDNGIPDVATPAGAATTDLQHVVFTRDAGGVTRLYVDGEPVATGTAGGDLSNWALTYSLSLAGNYNLGEPWLGEFRLAAVFNQALTSAEVLQNYEAGPGDEVVLCTGDTDCSGLVDFDDIRPLIRAMGGEVVYLGYYPNCQWLNADCNGDGNVDFDDIRPFVALIGTTCP